MHPPWANRIAGHGEAVPERLLANPRNWRVHPKEQQAALGELLDQVGWVQDVIVNQRTGHVVDGHLRVSLAIARQEPSIPVVYVDLSPEEEALVLASLDPLAAMAVTDEEMLRGLLAEVLPEAALGDMFDEMIGVHKQGKTDPDAIPEAPEPRTKPGDLWLLGEHRLLCGDATKPVDVERLMAGELAACLWTDPPYGVDYKGKTAEALTIRNDTAGGLAALLTAALANAGEVLESGAPFYIAHPPGPLSATFWNVVAAIGWQIHEGLVWVKDTMVLGHADYHYRHEPILYGWKPGPGRSGRGMHEGSRWYGDHSQTSVFEIPRPKASEEHPTMKPVELLTGCLANSTRPGDAVLDTFLGSGSTMIACEQLGRRCYAMEIGPRYVDVAVRRWEEFAGREATVVG
jgi:DNA modification methylase